MVKYVIVFGDSDVSKFSLSAGAGWDESICLVRYTIRQTGPDPKPKITTVKS